MTTLLTVHVHNYLYMVGRICTVNLLNSVIDYIMLIGSDVGIGIQY